MRYPADPPRAEEIIAVMRAAGVHAHGLPARALIAVIWRGGLRISEALAVTESDVDARRGSVLVRHGKGDKRREAGMDDWGFEHLSAWLERRVELPVGPLFCVIDGANKGRGGWSATAVRGELRRLALEAGVRRRFAPHQLRHAHAVGLAREGIAVNLIQRQLGHACGSGSSWRVRARCLCSSQAATTTRLPQPHLWNMERDTLTGATAYHSEDAPATG
jgi:site-specific recombinase XerD